MVICIDVGHFSIRHHYNLLWKVDKTSTCKEMGNKTCVDGTFKSLQPPHCTPNIEWYRFWCMQIIWAHTHSRALWHAYKTPIIDLFHLSKGLLQQMLSFGPCGSGATFKAKEEDRKCNESVWVTLSLTTTFDFKKRKEIVHGQIITSKKKNHTSFFIDVSHFLNSYRCKRFSCSCHMCALRNRPVQLREATVCWEQLTISNPRHLPLTHTHTNGLFASWPPSAGTNQFWWIIQYLRGCDQRQRGRRAPLPSNWALFGSGPAVFVCVSVCVGERSEGVCDGGGLSH